MSSDSFDWLSFPQKYWDPDQGVIATLAKTTLEYKYEYLGDEKSLWQTPMTRRAFTVNAMCSQFCMHAAFFGTAGTGKTETAKDFAKLFGRHAYIINCSDQMDVDIMFKIAKGMCMSGEFGIFDEFNRLDLNVMTIIAPNWADMLQALRTKAETMITGGIEHAILSTARMVVTANPSYAGRT